MRSISAYGVSELDDCYIKYLHSINAGVTIFNNDVINDDKAIYFVPWYLEKELEVNKMSLSLFIDIIDKFLIDSKGEPLTMKISDMTIDDFIKINIIFAEKFTTDDRTIEYDKDDLNVINNLLNEHTDNTVNMHTVVEGNKIFFILEPGSTNFIRSASIATKLPYFEFILNKLHDLYSNADMYKSKCFQKYLSIV